MVWIALVVGWVAAASLVAWLLGTAVARSERAEVPCSLDEATAEVPCPAEPEIQPELASAGSRTPVG